MRKRWSPGQIKEAAGGLDDETAEYLADCTLLMAEFLRMQAAQIEPPSMCTAPAHYRSEGYAMCMDRLRKALQYKIWESK
jgi:hypothetical protein